MLDLRTTQAVAYQQAHRTRSIVFLIFVRKIKRYWRHQTAVVGKALSQRRTHTHYGTYKSS